MKQEWKRPHQTETLEQVQLMHSGWQQQHRIETLEQEQEQEQKQEEQMIPAWPTD